MGKSCIYNHRNNCSSEVHIGDRCKHANNEDCPDFVPYPNIIILFQTMYCEKCMKCATITNEKHYFVEEKDLQATIKELTDLNRRQILYTIEKGIRNVHFDNVLEWNT